MPRLSFPRTAAQALGLRFASILAGVLVLALALGFAWLALENQEAALQEEQQRLNILEHRLVSSLKPLMQSGNPDLIWTWLEEVRDHGDIRTLRILRRDGSVAFRDLETLERVNDYLGKKAFERSARPSLTTEVPEAEFQRALAGEEISRIDTEAGIVTRLLPIPSSPQCQGCHGYETADYRGVLRVTADFGSAQGGVWTAYRHNLAISGMVVLVLVVTVLALVRRQITGPLKALAGVTSRLAAGDLEVRADATRPDELGTLARSFNRMAERLQRQMAELREVINRSPNGIVILDEEGSIQFTNPIARTLLNRTDEELLGSPLGIPLVTEGTTEIDIRQPGGGQGVAEVSAQPIEREGETGYLVTFHDVTIRKEAEDVAKDMAYHDELTGLANRALFQDWLGAALNDAYHNDRGLAVLFLDLDRFKEINDNLGHAAGDDFLQIMAGRLSDNVRESDTVARIGGDEFCILLVGVTERETAREVAEKILARLQEPVTLGGEAITPAATIGISLFPEDGDDPESLLMRADTSMYKAKEEGRNRVGS